MSSHPKSIDDLSPASEGARPRLLMASHSCHPDVTMEDRNGWHRAIQAAEDFDVTVLTVPIVDLDQLYEAVPNHLKGRIEFIAVPLSDWQRRQLAGGLMFYSAYRAWLRRGQELAEKLHSRRPFAITHLVSLCSYREPGYLWQLDCPFVFGPVGGTSGVAIRFLPLMSLKSGLFEVARNIVNYYQIHFCPRIRRALRSTAFVFAANESSKKDLAGMTGGSTIPVELETGLDYESSQPKPLRDSSAPLKILWSGRLKAWKALPLLLYAIARLPKDFLVELRVVGDGDCLKAWQLLAEKLGISDRVEWLQRPPYRESLGHYRWADVFSFTSLRDTSGTGLLESLAAGTPIIGMDHQGAADIMTDDCAMKISVRSPDQSIAEIAEAIKCLANDSDRLKRLSDGALKRSVEYHWDRKYGVVRATYKSLMHQETPADTLYSQPKIANTSSFDSYSTSKPVAALSACVLHYVLDILK